MPDPFGIVKSRLTSEHHTCQCKMKYHNKACQVYNVRVKWGEQKESKRRHASPYRRDAPGDDVSEGHCCECLDQLVRINPLWGSRCTGSDHERVSNIPVFMLVREKKELRKGKKKDFEESKILPKKNPRQQPPSVVGHPNPRLLTVFQQWTCMSTTHNVRLHARRVRRVSHPDGREMARPRVDERRWEWRPPVSTTATRVDGFDCSQI